MFWGLIIEPNKRYTQTVKESFHVSMASLDLTTGDDSIVQVMLCYENRNYLLCSLRKASTWQVPLDLNFEEGTEIAFTCNGHGHVHLTGYKIPDKDFDLDDEEEDDEAEEEEEEEEQIPQLVDKNSKRKAPDSLKQKMKPKRSKQNIAVESSDDEDIEQLDGNPNDDSDDLEESMLIEGEDDDDDDDSDNEEAGDEEEEEEEVEEKKPTKAQQKDKKNKQAQQQEQEQRQKQQQKEKKKEDKQKMLNGKETKPEQQTKQQKKAKAEQQQQNAQNTQNTQNEQKKRVVEGGVQIEDLKVGNGGPAKAGKFISVYYVGRLKNGKKFDATTQGDGFKFRLGKGEVIKGWDVGISGMKMGGKRRITIPPAMAYGAKGSPPVIPGNSTLVFEVELKNVH